MYQLGFSGFFKEIFPIITTLFGKGQLNSECIYEVIVSPKMPTKNLKDFCPGNLLESRAEILHILVGVLGETMTS